MKNEKNMQDVTEYVLKAEEAGSIGKINKLTRGEILRERLERILDTLDSGRPVATIVVLPDGKTEMKVLKGTKNTARRLLESCCAVYMVDISYRLKGNAVVLRIGDRLKADADRKEAEAL